MPVAIDTSVLISAERQGDLDELLPEGEEGPYYIPALAATEFLVGTQPPVRLDLRRRALQLYQNRLRVLVSAFTEMDAVQLATLIAELKAKGQQMKFFDAAVAATVLARGDKLLVLDTDFDRLKDRIHRVAPVSLRSGKNRAPAGFRRFAVAERGTPASQPQPAAAMAC
jgi:predicted nucleic acid-binding protein